MQKGVGLGGCSLCNKIYIYIRFSVGKMEKSLAIPAKQTNRETNAASCQLTGDEASAARNCVSKG